MGRYLVRDKALLAQRIDRVLNLFPMLKTRAGRLTGMMSGGEQRVLEIARTLLQEPQLIMLDEPSIGLSPKMVEAVFDKVRLLREQGKAILMVEQNVRKALSISDRGGVTCPGGWTCPAALVRYCACPCLARSALLSLGHHCADLRIRCSKRPGSSMPVAMAVPSKITPALKPMPAVTCSPSSAMP